MCGTFSMQRVIYPQPYGRRRRPVSGMQRFVMEMAGARAHIRAMEKLIAASFVAAVLVFAWTYVIVARSEPRKRN